MIGAWCFVDHFGPDDVAGRPGMQVPPHPHTGPQTVTEEIVAARADWMAGRRFGVVAGCVADPLPAPEMPTVRLKTRDRFGNTA